MWAGSGLGLRVGRWKKFSAQGCTDGVKEVRVVPVLAGGPLEVVDRHLVPQKTAVFAERDMSKKRRGSGKFPDAVDAAGEMGLMDEKCSGGESVADGAVSWFVGSDRKGKAIAKRLVAERGKVRPQMLGDAEGADPWKGAIGDDGFDEGHVEGGVVGCDGDGWVGEDPESWLDLVDGGKLAGDHVAGDVVDSRCFGLDGNTWVDEGVESRAVGAALEVDGNNGNFDDAVPGWVETGGFDIDDVDHGSWNRD